MLMPDHVSEVPAYPEARLQNFALAFAYGHICGLRQAAEHYLA
jgi:hypothetical protein